MVEQHSASTLICRQGGPATHAECTASQRAILQDAGLTILQDALAHSRHSSVGKTARPP